MWSQRLPKFNRDQLHYVEYYLVVVKPRRYKEIALHFRKNHPKYAPDVDDVLFIDLFTHKCRQMINDPRLASSSRIAEAREGNANIGDVVLLAIPRYRAEEHERIYEQMGELVAEMGDAPERLKSTKAVLSALQLQSKTLFNYEKRLRDQQRIDNMGGGISHITLPELENPVLDDKEEILEKWRRLTYGAGGRPVDASVWAIPNGREGTTGLPAFTPVQQAIVISCLIHYEPHREIARLLQHLETPEPSEVNEAYQGIIEDESIILPEGMSQSEYEERVIKRCKDYVSNKKRKPYQIIQAGRKEYSEQIVEWATAEINYMQNVLIGEIVRKYGELDIKDALELADKTYEMREAFFALLFDEEEDTGEGAVDEDATYAVTDPPHPLQHIEDTDTIETV